MPNFELDNAKEFYKNVEQLYDEFRTDSTEMEVLANDHKHLVVYGYKLFGFNIVEHNYYKYSEGCSMAIRPDIYFSVSLRGYFQPLADKYGFKLEEPPYAEYGILGLIFYDYLSLLSFFWHESEVLYDFRNKNFIGNG